MAPSAAKIFKTITEVPVAPFYENAVTKKILEWLRLELGKRVTISRRRGGIIIRYAGAGPGPSLALAAHTDHPAFHLRRVTASGARARLQGGLRKDLLAGSTIQAFSARPADNRPLAVGTLGELSEDAYPVRWSSPPARGAKPAFAMPALTPFSIKGKWLASRSIDDLLGVAVSLETLRRVARSRMKTNLTVFLNRAEEVGFVGAMDLILSGALSPDDSILSIETSKAIAGARPGRGPVIRVGDKTSAFDPNLLALLDAAAAHLKARGRRVQRTRLIGGTCEGTAYLAFGYESAGVAVPLVNYHNGGLKKLEPEKVRLEDVEGAVLLLVEAAKRFPKTELRGRLRARLASRHGKMSALLR